MKALEKLPFTYKQLEDWAGASVFSDAERLYREGMVLDATWDGENKVEGVIQKQPRDLKTRFNITAKGEIENGCPCSDSRMRGIVCAHVIAVGISLVKDYADPERREKLAQEMRRAQRLAEVDDNQFWPRSRGAGDGVEAKLEIMLPSDWQTSLGEGLVPLHIGLLLGKKRVSASDYNENPLPLQLSEEDENLLFVLEDIAEAAPSTVLDCKLPDFLNILALLQGRSLRLTESKNEVIVHPVTIQGQLRLDWEEETGVLFLQMNTSFPGVSEKEQALYLHSRSQVWAYAGDTFWKLDRVLPGPLQGIYTQPVVIERGSILTFLEQELPLLRKLMPVAGEVDESWFSLEPGKPQYRLLIKGSPASLSAILYARYNDEIEVVAAKDQQKTSFAIPDPDDLFHFITRNVDHECKTVSELAEFGFTGIAGDDLTSIIGQREVLNFLGSQLPTLRRLGWEVDVEGKVVSFLDDAPNTIPVVQVQNPEGADWFDVSYEFESSEGESLNATEIQRAIRMGDSFVKKGERVVLFDKDAIESMGRVFDDCSSGTGTAAGSFRVSSIHAGFVKSALDVLDGVDVEANPQWADTARRLNRDTDLKSVEVPKAWESVLRPYQLDGLRWLRFQEEQGFCGILADDMGLGKTVQTLAWVSMQRSDPDLADSPTLIICPSSLVENWIEEGQRFVPDLKFLNYSGSDRAKDQENIDAYDVVVTSYAIARRDIEFMESLSYAVVVLDEAQYIKNHATQNSKAVKSLRSRHRLVLTGTPIENGVSDLWSIMDFLMPGYLNSHEHFRLSYENPIKNGGTAGLRAQQRLRKKLHPFLLRRLKRDVAKDLPPKLERTAYCTLTKDQQLVYRELVQRSRKEITDMVDQQGFNKSRMTILTTLMRLRQICCHLELLKLSGVNSKQPSGKLNLFDELLNESISGGHRILVFSQFTGMLKILREYLEANGHSYCYLDGQTKNRQSLVKQFNRDKSIPVFLISLKAGGTGLNLTGADTVIHFDPWWNPAVENQATDRAYRIGQTRKVYSIKLITKNTVEEKVLKMQEKKKALYDATLGSDEELMQKLDWEDVQELLG